jgi:hypothetical protein
MRRLESHETHGQGPLDGRKRMTMYEEGENFASYGSD